MSGKSDWRPIATIPRQRPADVVELLDDQGRVTEGFHDEGQPLSYLASSGGARPPFVSWRPKRG
jgi:hypothetical protein